MQPGRFPAPTTSGASCSSAPDWKDSSCWITSIGRKWPSSQLSQWFKEGRIRYRVEVVEGLENAPTAINKLFDGSHKGKLIVKVSEEPSL